MVRVYITRRFNTNIRMNHMQQSEWARRLLDIALKREYPELCAPILLERDKWGKPFLAEYPDIFINLSHSGIYAACAIGEKPVGVDVEAWKTRKQMRRIVEKFHPFETKAFLEAEEAEREALFHDIWVLKESFLKAVGKGLRLPLNSFCTLPGMEQVVQTMDEKRYYSKLYRLEGEACSLSVCSEEKELAEEPVWITISEGS